MTAPAKREAPIEQKPIPKPTIPKPSPFPIERIPTEYDGRMPLELWETIQIPTDRHPFKAENIWETEICDFFEDCNECSANFLFFLRNLFYKSFKINELSLFCSLLLLVLPLWHLQGYGREHL